MLLELALPLFATAMWAAFVVMGCKQRTWKSLIPIAILTVFAGLVDSRFYFQVRRRAELGALPTSGIRRVYVAGKWRRDPELGAAVVEALRETEWFSMNHGGTGERQWLIVEYDSGRQERVVVAPYRREPGAVIEFGRPAGGGGFQDGYAFSRGLPASLARFGLALEGEAAAAR